MSRFRSEISWNKLPNKTGHMLDPLAVIYNENQWRVNKVSPLYNLQNKTVKLKQYTSKIKQALVSAIPGNSSIKYTVKIEEQPLLKYCDNDAGGLMITVLSGQDNNSTKLIYTGILLSWGMSSSLDGATHLPYMIERGEQKIGNSVKSTLQKMFDCIIIPFSFTQQQVLQFGLNWIEHDTSRNTDPFVLVYRTPKGSVKDKLTLLFEVEDIKLIWSGIQEEATNLSELISMTYQVLQNQIFYAQMLDITALDLCEVSLPKSEVKTNGTIKMKSPEVVNAVFMVLNEICNLSKE